MYRYGLNDPLQQVGNVSSSNVRSTDIVCVFFLTVITVVDAVMDDNETLDFPQTLRWINFAICTTRVMVANIFL